ncbi:MAG: citrate synthase, partial [Lachnospiraceae bacterium]|nr:citrate synthase [Lachnospiraceae bacterium]
MHRIHQSPKDMEKYVDRCVKNDSFSPELFKKYGVKRGLRDVDGSGVLTGLTDISKVEGSVYINGKKTPAEGRLWYRGYSIEDLVSGLRGNGYAFEEAAYLLLFGDLPGKKDLKEFSELLERLAVLPRNFIRDVIMKAPTPDLMNSMTRSVLTLASYDDSVIKETDLDAQLLQCLKLIAVMPMLAVYGYHAYNYYSNLESMYIHRPKKNLSVAENLLAMLRPDRSYTELEVEVLDIALLLHMEHGGGNNSTFTTRVITSSGSDTYSTMAAALCSLKGPKHGGANIKVVNMMDDIKKHLGKRYSEGELADYLTKILEGEAFDKKGLIYGMGHAIYSKSDPRATVFRQFVEELASEKGRFQEFKLYSS